MHRPYWVFVLAGLVLAGCLGRRGELKPLNPAAGRAPVLLSQPQLVTFAELEADPERYRDTLLRVTGDFYHLPPPACFPANGAPSRWALVDSGLRLDAVGLEERVNLSAEAVSFTVDGIFRLYLGPVGCGKEPPAATSWYLQAFQIIEPNPLIRSDRPPGYDVVIVVPTIPAPALLPGGGTPPPGLTRTPAGTATGAAQPTTPAAGTTSPPTPTLTASPTRAATPGASPTAAGTPSPGPSPTPEPTGGAPPTATPGGGGYPPPPAPTATPPGYPG